MAVLPQDHGACSAGCHFASWRRKTSPRCTETEKTIGDLPVISDKIVVRCEAQCEYLTLHMATLSPPSHYAYLRTCLRTTAKRHVKVLPIFPRNIHPELKSNCLNNMERRHNSKHDLLSQA